VVIIRTNLEERACDLAVYIIDNKATVRAAAKHFGISNLRVHKDLTDRLRHYNLSLFRQVKDVLETNKA
jgi:putative DeoR family transcriptional regulator (stage III sporulation protein D)